MCKYCEIKDETPTSGAVDTWDRIDWVPDDKLIFDVRGNWCCAKGAIVNGKLRVYVSTSDGDGMDDIKISHCPMCGKSLK